MISKFQSGFDCATHALRILSGRGDTNIIVELLLTTSFVVNFSSSFKKLDPAHQGEDGDTCLHVACKEGRFKNVREFVKILANNDINIYNNKNQTALHAAVKNRNPKCVREVLEHENIDVNIQDIDGFTPLHIAAQVSNLECAKLLKGKGAILDISDNISKIPHYYAKNDAMKKLLQITGGMSVSKDEESIINKQEIEARQKRRSEDGGGSSKKRIKAQYIEEEKWRKNNSDNDAGASG